MILGQVTFYNATGQPVAIYVRPPHAHQVQVTTLQPARTSPALNGRLIHIDLTRDEVPYSYAFAGDMLLVEDESPYRLTQVLAAGQQTLLLVIHDNEGNLVGEYESSAPPLAPAILAAGSGPEPPLPQFAAGLESLEMTREFFNGQQLAPSVARARLASLATEPSSPQTVFNSSSGGLVTIILAEQEVGAALEKTLETRRQQMFDITGVASAYVRGQASEQKNPNLVYDTLIWQDVFNHLPLMGPSEFVSQQFSQHLRGLEIAGKFLQTIVGYAVAGGGSVLTQFSTFLQGLGEQIRLGIESGTKSFSVGSITIVLQQQRDDVLGILKGYFLNFTQRQTRIYSNCGSAEAFDVEFDYRTATSVFNAGALQKPEVKKAFDAFITGTQLDDVKKASNFFSGKVPPPAA